MKSFICFGLLSLCLFCVAVFAIIGQVPSWFYLIPTAVGIVAMVLILRGIILPSRVVTRGIDLIGAQDYNNRLMKVGESNADHIVNLFNSFIDKLRAERLLNREQEGFLNLLVEASPMGVLILDFDRKVTLVNRAFIRMFEIDGKDLPIGKGFHELSNDIINLLGKVDLGKSEIIRQGDFRIFRCYHLNFIQEGFKREFYLLESLTDEIMRAEKAAYETVIRTISHEVNNTIGGIKVVLDMMKEQSADRELTEVIESCDLRCDKMCRFVSDYAEVVKLPQPQKRLIDIVQELNQMLPFMHRMLPPGISLCFKSSAAKVELMADSVQLQQVIVNIVKNAAESIKTEGYIEITAADNGKHGVTLEIANNGEPIIASASSKIFTPFFTTKPNGKGLGLTLAREVLTRHQAAYRLFTDSNGVTRFTITFPRFTSKPELS